MRLFIYKHVADSPRVRKRKRPVTPCVPVRVDRHYIYGDYEILDETGQAVPYKRAGSRIAEVQGKPDVRQITSDVLETGVGRIAICGRLCHFLLLQ